MTDTLLSATGWCVLQVSVVALAAVIGSLWVVRRSAVAACSMVCMANVVCAALTFVAPLPVHHWFIVESRPDAVVATRASNTVPPSDSTELANEQHHDSSALPKFSLQDVASSLRSLVAQVERIEDRGSIAVHTVYWFLLAATAIGLLRLAVQLAYVRSLRRKGVPITEARLLDLLERLTGDLHCRVIPAVRANDQFTDAAIAGWWRPTLILPTRWSEWTTDELRAVLAHELAHLVRRDTFWRMVSASLLAVHFYNPVVHWLMRRVMLYQELSADALAATIIGRRSYLQSLSSLAIRYDDQLRRMDSPDVLPVFSGHLIRRITMLHSMDGRSENETRGRWSVASAFASTALLFIAVGAVATRGMAQPPQAESQAASAFKRVSLTKVVPDNQPGTDPTQALFCHTSLDPAIAGSKNRQGLIVVRSKEILQRTQIQGGVPMLNAMLSMWLASELKSESPPAVMIETVEWIAAVPQVTFKAETKDQKSQFALGTQRVVFRLAKPVDLKQWVKEYAPDAKEHLVEGKPVYEFAFPSLGPVSCVVWAEDETTIRATGRPIDFTPETKMADLNLTPKQKDSADGSPTDSTREALVSNWPATWNQIDRGLVSILLAQADLSGLIGDLDHKPDFQSESIQHMGRALRDVISRCATSAFAFDLAETTSDIGIRASFTHSSRELAIASAKDLQDILTRAKAELARHVTTLKADNAEDAIELAFIQLYDDAVRTATVSVDEYGDKSAAVVVATMIPLNRFVQVILQSAKESSTP